MPKMNAGEMKFRDRNRTVLKGSRHFCETHRGNRRNPWAFRPEEGDGVRAETSTARSDSPCARIEGEDWAQGGRGAAHLGGVNRMKHWFGRGLNEVARRSSLPQLNSKGILPRARGAGVRLVLGRLVLGLAALLLPACACTDHYHSGNERPCSERCVTHHETCHCSSLCPCWSNHR